MKYCTMFLAFCLAAAAPAGLYADQAADAAKAEAKAQAEKRKAAQQKIRDQFGQLYPLLRAASETKKLEEAEKISRQMVDLVKQPEGSTVLADVKHIVIGYLYYFPKVEKERLNRYYPALISMAEGDMKANFITEYIRYLEKRKWASAEEIAALRKSQLAIKGLSDMRRFRLLVENNDLKTADATAEKLLAAEQKNATKIGLIGTFLSAFREKKVFGSDYVNKYFQKQLALAESADTKADIITRYAKFLKEYCIVPDEEADKLLESRYSLPGITPVARARCYVDDLKALNGDSDGFTALYGKALADIKADPAARRILYSVLSSNLRMDCLIPLIQTASADREANGHLLLTTYASTVSWGSPSAKNPKSFDAMEAFLKKTFEQYEKEFAPLHAAALGARLNYLSAKAVSDAAAKRMAEARQEAAKAGSDKGAKEKALASLKAANEAAAKANTATAEKNRAMQDALNARNPAADRFIAAGEALAAFYKNISPRYYDSPNPYTMKKALDVMAILCNAGRPFDDPGKTIRRLHTMTEMAFNAGDYDSVRKFNEQARKIADDYARKTSDARMAGNIRKSAQEIGRFVGFAAYKEENYEEAVRQLKPFIEDKNNPRLRNQCLETYARSLVAVGRAEEAVPLFDDMIAAAEFYMKSRLQEQVRDLKERVEKAKTAK